MSGDKHHGPAMPPRAPASTSSPTSGEGSDSALEVLRKKRQMGIVPGEGLTPVPPVPPAPAGE